MIRVVDRSNRQRYLRTMDQYFRLRHAAFVKERGWTQFEQDGVYEKDQYDDDNAIYLISLDEHENVVGSARLYPTTLPHMLSDHFANLVNGAVPQRRDLLEFTRLAIDKNLRGSQSRIYYKLWLGLQEFCLDQGYVGATTLVRTLRIPVVQKTGLDVIPLGLAQEIDGEYCTAALIPVDEASLERARRIAGITGSVMEDGVMEDSLVPDLRIA